jgi:hypothetical protein
LSEDVTVLLKPFLSLLLCQRIAEETEMKNSEIDALSQQTTQEKEKMKQKSYKERNVKYFEKEIEKLCNAKH